MDIQETLQTWVDMFAQMGHPAIIERFVLRNGKVMLPVPFKGRRMKAKECFANATHKAMAGAGTYAEGFGLRPMIGFPVHHAWVGVRKMTMPDGSILEQADPVAMDPTWNDPTDCQYMGVEFEEQTLCAELSKLKHYGLLDTYRGINVDLIWKLDPELKDIVHSIIGQRKIEQ